MNTSHKQLKINLPEDVKFWLEERARKNLRSQSSEIVMALREKMRSNNENEKADATAS
ncbi:MULTISPECIES: Arc domain-containing protein [Rhizobium/Agrobacterium group]|uniref:Arc domain-containing protein n=1 Tax=Rhizobium/Agrobacterium group TaxID=227290 RepID=UPI0002E4AF1F|nr:MULTISPECIES: Arc domain-containing protein [Rhizobium/Agrobacterium group]